MPKPKVMAIYTAPDQGDPMVSHKSIKAIAGLGLAGDRYALQKGSWKAKGEKTHKKKRNLTLISLQGIRNANRDRPPENIFYWEETRRNLVIKDMDVNVLIGKEFAIGDVRCRGVEYAEPCNRPSALCYKSRFQEAFHGNGGVNCEILTDGEIKVGDTIIIL